ncbi:nucleoside deaminase [Salinisphaera sp. Q1T1-3]|uniref:nucleoside deaminase n=1 Tax=Salinisphaera sp. Q1T1-3 TaxID=2321229 RepID=UPI000E734933|nr:nucleoside deaminase [Salinisphaera sp. Q1T1-3]RJS91942.1 nucleoside deaminase [Salinisphaera sp. Q1T1-3]
MNHAHFMHAALEQARLGRAEGGIPIGCVLVRDNEIVATGRNRRVQQDSAVLHAEMDALETLGRRPGAWYDDVTLYTTLSPCPMCAGAILLYGIPRVVIGENTSFMGDEAHLTARGVSLTVLDDADCRQAMTEFMRDEPRLWFEDIGR